MVRTFCVLFGKSLPTSRSSRYSLCHYLMGFCYCAFHTLASNSSGRNLPGTANTTFLHCSATFYMNQSPCMQGSVSGPFFLFQSSLGYLGATVPFCLNHWGFMVSFVICRANTLTLLFLRVSWLFPGLEPSCQVPQKHLLELYRICKSIWGEVIFL